MLGYTKLKIIINKMTDFINKLVDIVVKNHSKIDNNYKYNYFQYYSQNISSLDEKSLETIYELIDRSSKEIDNNMIKDITYFLSCDISNEIVIASSKNIQNYVVFCLYSSLIDVKVRRMYFNKKTIINVKEKVRPDKYLCEILNYKNEFMFNGYAKVILQLPLVKNFESRFRVLKEIKPPMPYFDVLDNLIIYERPIALNPNKDALIDVLKDVVNQLKTINLYYWFEYIDKNSIGRSENGLKRYFIFFFDSLIERDQKLTSHNVYDGRYKYDMISFKDQIRTVIHILSEIYVTGEESYVKKCQIEPFDEYLRVLDELEERNIHNNFILYLMNIKNESR